jgi:hypothetical protein
MPSLSSVTSTKGRLDTSFPLRSRTPSLSTGCSILPLKITFIRPALQSGIMLCIALGIRIRELLDTCILTRLTVPYLFIVSTTPVPQTTFIPCRLTREIPSVCPDISPKESLATSSPSRELVLGASVRLSYASSYLMPTTRLEAVITSCISSRNQNLKVP